MASTKPDPDAEPAYPAGVMPEWGREGRRLGRYVLGPVLGRGGMGEVFEAWDLLLARPVAVKLLTSGSFAALTRFMQEAKLQARVDHPNICRVLDADVQGDLPYIAMQLVKGPPLKAAGLSPFEIAGVMQKVASAIHAAHRVGLIHRDLKPSNILIERNEQGGWTPYVCDFGLAKDLEAEALTQTQMPMGTPAFMAPEQMLTGSASVGPAADVYGLGATLCDLVTGNPPAQGTPQTPWHWTGPFGWAPPTISADLPGPIISILSRCLAWHVDERYPTAAALAEDLRRFQDGEPLLSVQVSPWKRLALLSRRRPLPVALAGVLVALGIGAGTMGLVARQASSKRAQASATFAGLIKDLQYEMRVERMMPPHDLRPAFGRVRARMEAIRTRMAKEGAVSQGPGHFALGWGHLLLREPQAALQEFRHAWALGTRSADVAHAEVLACCEAYVDELPLARQDGRDALAALARKYLDSAMECLTRIGPENAALRGLAEGKLELLRRNPHGALALAETLKTQAPGTYEAHILEAAAHSQMGFSKQLQGDYAEANRHYGNCDKALQVAQNLARSDEEALKVELNRRLAWVAVQDDAGFSPIDTFDRIEATADRLLALNPEWLPAVADRLTVIWRRAEFELERGNNPRAAVEKGLALLSASEHLANSGLRLHRDRLNLCRLLAEIQLSEGKDPSAIVQRGLSSPRQDEFTADLRWVYARWLVKQGQDPNPQLDLALQHLERPSFQNSEEYGLAGRKAQAWRTKGAWALKQGGDARSAAQRSLEEAMKAEKANPSSLGVRVDLALGRELLFQSERKAGQWRPELLNLALNDARRACQIGATNVIAQHCLALVLTTMAETSPSTAARGGWKSEAQTVVRGIRTKGILGSETRALEKRLAVLR